MPDRVLAAALNQAVSPYVDHRFHPRSFGFRPGRSHWHMLAAVKRFIDITGMSIVVNEDIRKAFDSVDTQRVLDDCGLMIPDPRIMSLISTVVKGHGGNKKGGIPQGNATSPVLLNIHLHLRHDAMICREHFIVCWARYADNLLYIAKNMTDGRVILAQSQDVLKRVDLDLKGMVKGVSEPIDLRVKPTTLLGFELSAHPELRLDIPSDTWEGLRTDLQDAHWEDDPETHATSLLYGWAAACGPALENQLETVLDSTLALAEGAGFRRLITAERLQELLMNSLKRWRGLLRSAT